MTRGHPVRGFFAGLFLGICIDLDLAFGGAVRLDSSVLTIVPIVLIVVCLIMGTWAPIGRSRRPRTKLVTPLPPPVAWPEAAPTEGSTAPPQGGQWAAPPPPGPATAPVPPFGDEPPSPASTPPPSPPPI